MYILSISCFYHDSSATLLKDGQIVAAAAEERFSRKKHDSSFPNKAIKYCLDSQKINIDDIDYISFYEKPLLKFERVLYQFLETFPWGFKMFVTTLPLWLKEKIRIPKIIKKKLKYKKDIFFIEHHLAHADSSFLASPFEKSAILVVDGVGEWATTSFGVGEGNNIKLIKELNFPHSLGLLYSTITAYLGFSVNNSEYKVMGLSAYGEMDKNKNEYYKKIKNVIDIKEDGSFRLDMNYFIYHYSDRMPSSKLCELLGGPIRIKESEITQRHKDIATALQLVTEEVMTKILHYIYKKTKCKNIVLAGGVALNSLFNGKIIKNTPFKNIWIQPDSGDGGTSIGTALYVYNTILGNKRNYEFKNVYLGPEYTIEEIELYLKKNNIKYDKINNIDKLIRKTAQLIYQDKIVGWFQGRMEWGPRALGNRSILANPLNPDMKNILNLKVKHRENFRPFAPAVCEDDALKYFECKEYLSNIAKYMLAVCPVRAEWKNKLSSVTHIDGTARVQIVNRDDNPIFFHLIKEFGKLSGIPVVINTSFNVRGEPIVCTPGDAYNCIVGTEIDYLVMGRFLINKKDNLHHVFKKE